MPRVSARKRGFLVGLLVGLPVGLGVSMEIEAQAAKPQVYLAVWSGDADRQDDDFLAVLDADPESPGYASVVATVPVGARAMQPHHTEYQHVVGRSLFAAGFAGDRLFRFDLTDARAPRLTEAPDRPPDLHHPHSIARLASGDVLVTYQASSAAGAAPGGLAVFRDDGTFVRSTRAGFSAGRDANVRPYSVAIVESADRVAAAAGRMPLPGWHPGARSSSADRRSPDELGFHVQLYDATELSWMATVALVDPSGRGAHLSPWEPRVLEDGETVLVSTAFCGLYRVRGLERATFGADLVHRFLGRGCSVPLRIGQFWVQSIMSTREIVVLDVSEPRAPLRTSSVVLAEGQSPHWLAWDVASARIVVANDAAGEARLHMLRFDPRTGRLWRDDTFREPGSERPGWSFERATWPHGRTGAAVPHGAVFVRPETLGLDLR